MFVFSLLINTVLEWLVFHFFLLASDYPTLIRGSAVFCTDTQTTESKLHTSEDRIIHEAATVFIWRVDFSHGGATSLLSGKSIGMSEKQDNYKVNRTALD